MPHIRIHLWNEAHITLEKGGALKIELTAVLLFVRRGCFG